jgi:hypothetical protein
MKGLFARHRPKLGAMISIGLLVVLSFLPLTGFCRGPEQVHTPKMEWVQVSKDGRRFVLAQSRRRFVAWGFNYDHDASEQERLLEDYWEADWGKVRRDFYDMKSLGANVVRIHLQFGRFLQGPDQINTKVLAQLGRLIALAEETGLYLDLTGLGSYRKADVPGWYNALAEAGRWAVQARFWEAVAARSAASPSVFCYNLMNEPAVPAEPQREWLAAPFTNGRYYVEFLSRDPGNRSRLQIGRKWLRAMTDAIRKHDRKHLVTVGIFLINDQASNLPIGAAPKELASEVDFFSVHLYPKENQMDSAIGILKQLAVGKPIVVEEMAPLNCSIPSLRQFIEGSRPYASGWMGFYWGKTLEEYRRSKTIGDALMFGWLELFQSLSRNTGSAL